MKPIDAYIDKNGIIYWNKFSKDPAPIPCPYGKKYCSGFCPHVYVFEGFNETVIGFTCGQKSMDWEVNLKWHEKPETIKFPYGVGYAVLDCKEAKKLEGSLGRYEGVGKYKLKGKD